MRSIAVSLPRARKQPPAKAKTRSRVKERGVALIVVMCFLAILQAMVTEYTTNSTVNFAAAVNARETMRAQFLNRSGANLGELLIRVQTDLMDKNRQLVGDIQITDYTPMFMGAFGGSKEEAQALADFAGGFDADAIEGLGVSAGEFSVDITPEDGKLNLNCANGSETSRTNLRTQLEALFFFQAYDKLFQEPSADGWQRTRDDQVAALMDYVDKDTARNGERGSGEDYGYESLDDDYLPKNNYLDSREEIKLIRGVDDRFWTLFGGQLTVYGSCKVNIGALREPKLISSVIFLAAQNPEDPVVRDSQLLWKLAQRVAKARSFNIYFDDLKAFADFVKDPDAEMRRLLTGAGEDGEAGGTPIPLPPGFENLEPVQGVELDAQKLGQVAESGPRRLYRVEVTSQFGKTPQGEPRITRKLVGIYDTEVQNQNARNPQNRRGNWVFWREE